MSEANDTMLKNINEFVADCAKSILLNNVKADEIKDNIKDFNEEISTALINMEKQSELYNNKEITKIIECQKSICDLLSQNNENNEKLINSLAEKLSQTKDELNSSIVAKFKDMDNKIKNFQDNSELQHNELINTFTKGINFINKNIDSEKKILIAKSKFLPWITVGIYASLAVVTIILLKVLKII